MPFRFARLGLALVTLWSLASCIPSPDADLSEEVIRRNILGTAYLGQQKWAEAEQAFRHAAELRPQDPLILTNTAVALMQNDQGEQAESLLLDALAADPDYAYAHYNLGLLSERRGEFEQAARSFEVVARFDPEDLFTKYYLATAYARTDRTDEAEQAFRAALERDPTHVSSLYGLGRLLLRAGADEEGGKLIALSQQIRERSGLNSAVGTQYGEQGPYAMGIDYPADALAVPDEIPVLFNPSARCETTGPWTVLSSRGGPPQFLVASGADLRALDPAGLSEPVAPPAPGGGTIVALVAGDVDNDADVDVIALLDDGKRMRPALLLQDDGKYAWADAPAFGAAAASPRAETGLDMVVLDRDHDGDLDLVWCWTASEASGCTFATNDGQGRFDAAPSGEHGFELDARAEGPIVLAFSDLDNDRDIDLLLAGTTGVRVLTNQRDGTFADISARLDLERIASRVVSLEVADMNKDGFMDLLLGTRDGVQLLRNRRGVRFEAAGSWPFGGEAGTHAVVLDSDNDGFLDFVRSGVGAPVILRNAGQSRWNEAVRPDPPEGSATGDLHPVAAYDSDLDGGLDIVARDATGYRLFLNDGAAARDWIKLDSKGVGDNRFGIGTKVEVLAGALRQKFEVTRPLPIHVGLDRRGTVQSARYLWPSGVLQDEIELEAGITAEIAQLDRKGTSCPLLYAWRDEGWEFVTDFLGGAAIGYQKAPGRFSTPDTDEYVRIEGGLSPGADGLLRVRLNNQLEEVIWFDQVELIAVDHPQGTEVYPNERLMPGPPWPEFELFASSDVRPVVAARDPESGEDRTAELMAADRRWIEGFRHLPYKGYAEMHGLEIDLGPFPAERRAVLLLDGWIDYADSSANVAAHQAGVALSPPRLSIADGRGGWSATEGLMGFPAGLPKTMAVELTGLFESADHRIRIETNMRIYWDRARVMIGGAGTELKVRRLTPAVARLNYGGFPVEQSADGRPPLTYDPEQVDAYRFWKAHVGRYTPFGDVRELLTEIDDRLVTTKNGDELELGFAAPDPPAAGWTRTYLVFADGFGKDMDPNSAASERVGPLPFHGMPTYPYADDVAPPRQDTGEQTAGRTVPASPRGWPGAIPQPLSGRLEQRTNRH